MAIAERMRRLTSICLRLRNPARFDRFHETAKPRFDFPQCVIPRRRLDGFMATVQELWNMAHDLYARARASFDPSTKRKLMGVADNYLRQAEDIRRERVTIQAAFPEPSPHASETKMARGRRVAGR